MHRIQMCLQLRFKSSDDSVFNWHLFVSHAIAVTVTAATVAVAPVISASYTLNHTYN